MMKVVKWHLGNAVHTDLTPRNSVGCHYCGVMTDFSVTPTKFDGQEPIYDFQDVVTKLTTISARNKMIVELARHIRDNHQGCILITSSRKEHVYALAKLLEDENPAVLVGGVSGRKALYADICRGVYKYTIATQSIVAEGASNPKWHHVIVTTPFSEPKTMEQLKGRPIRIDPDDPTKKAGFVWDLVDNVTMLRNMGRVRYRAILPHLASSARWSEWRNGLREIQQQPKGRRR
jgi:hypothetical protein